MSRRLKLVVPGENSPLCGPPEGTEEQTVSDRTRASATKTCVVLPIKKSSSNPPKGP